MLQYIQDSLAFDQRRWFLWTPVATGLGIALYFSTQYIPPLWIQILLAGVILLLWRSTLKSRHHILQFAGWALLWCSIGWIASTVSTWRHQTPLIENEIGPISLKGTLVSVDFFDHETRFVLENIVFVGKDLKHAVPLKKIRISWRGKIKDTSNLLIGNRIRTRAVLLPPKNPVFKGAYNFRRHAYFMGLSATGYCLKEPKVIEEGNSLELKPLQNMRHQLTMQIRHQLQGETGGIVAALVTGDRSGISAETREHFARSGVAHILAISGLHLSLIAGIFFFSIRRLFSLIPLLALQFPLKKISALFAWLATFLYLILCDFAIPAERAFIMISIFFLAILNDREAISFRSVALAALIILLIKPEALIHPSFQLSFAAVTALIAFYDQHHKGWFSSLMRSPSNRMIRYFMSLIVSSLIASLATTPYIAAFFHHITFQSITGNLLAVPLLGFMIMPLILVFLITLLWGGSHSVNHLLEFTLHVLKNYLAWVSSLKGALVPIPIMSWPLMGVFTLSMLWFFFWRSQWRYLGCLGAFASFLAAFFITLPDIYIDPDRKLIAFHEKQNNTIIVNTLQSARFARKSFVEACGTENVERLPSKNGFYTYGPLLFHQDNEKLTVIKEQNTIVFSFNGSCVKDIFFNGATVDLFGADSQGILMYLKKGYIEVVSSTPQQSDHPWG